MSVANIRRFDRDAIWYPFSQSSREQSIRELRLGDQLRRASQHELIVTSGRIGGYSKVGSVSWHEMSLEKPMELPNLYFKRWGIELARIVFWRAS